MIVDKIKELNGIELLPNSSCSPDLAPSYYYLFKSMAHFLRGRQLKNVSDIRIRIQVFIDSKPKEWYRQGLHDLAKR